MNNLVFRFVRRESIARPVPALFEAVEPARNCGYGVPWVGKVVVGLTKQISQYIATSSRKVTNIMVTCALGLVGNLLVGHVHRQYKVKVNLNGHNRYTASVFRQKRLQA